ncbi:hypothetical protein, partial [Aquirufa antheringensis]|uniref:hypothetical protein n=1 Tax=Aquirufa antheringensis TaxID=2516559 RepID=UPI0022A8CCAE
MDSKKTPEEIREIGKKFLDELKEKGPNLNRVGKTFVRVDGVKPDPKIEEIEDEPLSKARQFRKLKIDLVDELKEMKDQINKNNEDN